MSIDVAALGYLVAAVCFILALRGLSSPASARAGNRYGMVGMALAVAITLLLLTRAGGGAYAAIVVALAAGGALGFVVARRIQMTAMPQLVAAFHSLVGLAAVFVAAGAFLEPQDFGIVRPDGSIKPLSLLEMALGTIIGAVTFTGSVIAFGKLQAKFPPSVQAWIPAALEPVLAVLMSSRPILLPGRHWINAGIGAALVLLLLLFMVSESGAVFVLMTLLAFALGVLLIIPIGGADMPVVVSMLNSYSGWAAAGIGFTLQNPMLIITGALVGSSGAILSYIMCRAMNRSFVSVILGGFGETGAAAETATEKTVRAGSPEDAAFILENAQKVIIVPGYGMAVAQAQHAVRELYEALTKKGVEVKFAIHPVAGRMPGHMNVLLAEANIPYDVVFEMDEINNEFGQADAAYVIGANDITNPAAKTDPNSPIYGMPVLDVEKAKAVFFVKRSMAPGYAGIDNPLFYMDRTMMLFGDAKKVTEEIVKVLSGGH
ncbi:MAG: NAD(P)(+) transhydrogenase (Re/Si-specific) subunit beta [Geminicoccaceae bacterium]|nr:NAD(P)(+) transhydrogenase (Re/Si-specific) subunit beta [Geminicoccaceae bacterium]MCS7268725.1 NAD(P)(+) transhydrogenase (Re/Si-specific) subunit beta [Geminicoccaceae bacterium]MDW8125801.1 NAD(P)(+) transhydrogenase (Re/Si-specific) subunit beta [Geminicoccaceae bacterium]MDW8342609.1 NAD(P)(+) transhydrogenase (Re/Si-specific) subunit beta [Geminicoccaceae bacterium]